MTTRIVVAFGVLSAIAAVSVGIVGSQSKTTVNAALQQSLVRDQLELYQAPPPDCDPVNDPSSCRSS